MIIIQMLSVAPSAFPIPAVSAVFADGGAASLIPVTSPVVAVAVPIAVALSAVIAVAISAVVFAVPRSGATATAATIVTTVHGVPVTAGVIRKHWGRVLLLFDVGSPAPENN